MKSEMKAFYTFLLLQSVGLANAQVTRELKKIDSLAVPSIIIRKFHKLAPTGRKVSWTYEHTTQIAGPAFDFYRSEFKQNDNPGGTTFDGDGKLLDFQVYAKLDTLSRAVQNTIKKQVNRIKQKYPGVVMDICVMDNTQENPDTHEEKLALTYRVEFFKSPQARLALERLYRFAVDIDSSGRIISKSKGHIVDFR